MLADARKWAVKPQRLLVTIKLTHYHAAVLLRPVADRRTTG